jgi:transcriptional regulator with XRE-family HTH domain
LSRPDSPTASRRELGTLLRALRTDHDWTVQYVASRIGVSASKVSRLETGLRGASARDIQDLSDLYQVDEELRNRLADLAAEGKQRPWWPHGLAYTRYQGLETSAVSIEDYALGLMPGLLQTADYARAIVTGTAGTDDMTPADIEMMVAGRVLRQRLLDSDNAPRYTAVIDEAVLRRVVGSPAVMAAQLRHLLDTSELPSVDIHVISLEAGPLASGNNKFVILRFGSPELPTVVFIESLHEERYLDKPQDVKVYTRAFAALTRMALSADESRELTRTILRQHEAQDH